LISLKNFTVPIGIIDVLRKRGAKRQAASTLGAREKEEGAAKAPKTVNLRLVAGMI
jgi:hypothetical protein